MTDQKPSTSVALATDKAEVRPTIAAFIKSQEAAIAAALPKHLNSERFVRLVITSMRKTPKLQECSPVSVVGALLTASALGLEPGVNNEAHLVPYNDRKRGMECQLIIGYGGMAKQFWQHPLAARLSAEYVCENDHFEYDKGLNPYLHHRPATGDRGPVVAYYAIAGLIDRPAIFDVFTPEQVKKLRGGKVGTSGDIADPEHWMERKTVIRQVLKLMPKSPELTAAMAVDERRGSIDAARAIKDGLPVPEQPYIEGEIVGDEPPENVNPETGEYDGPMFGDADV